MDPVPLCSRRVFGIRYLKSLVCVDGRVLASNQMAVVQALCETGKAMIRQLQHLHERPALQRFVASTAAQSYVLVGSFATLFGLCRQSGLICCRDLLLFLYTTVLQ